MAPARMRFRVGRQLERRWFHRLRLAGNGWKASDRSGELRAEPEPVLCSAPVSRFRRRPLVAHRFARRGALRPRRQGARIAGALFGRRSMAGPRLRAGARLALSDVAPMYDVSPNQYTTVIRDFIKHENDVTNHRIMWLLIGQERHEMAARRRRW